MTKRLKILLAIFLFLVAAVLFSLYEPSASDETQLQDISLKDTSAIHRITFSKSSKGETVLEKNDGGKWMVNGQYEARDYLINLVITGFNKLEVKREVAVNARGKIIDDIRSNGYFVRVLNQKGDILNSFNIANNENDPNSSYYLPAEGGVPLIVYVPGFEGSIANVFNLDLSEWRDKVFFTANERNLQRISVKYPAFPNESFTISYKEGKFQVDNVSNVDSSKVFAYLNNFSLLTINKYYMGADADSIQSAFANKHPLAVLNLESLAEKRQLDIYEQQGRFYGYIPDQKEWVSLRPELYNRILVKKGFFENRK